MADPNDMFDLGDPASESTSEPESTPEPESASEPEVENVTEEVPTGYVVEHLSAAHPGWSAIYDNPENEEEILQFPIAAIGLVIMTYESGEERQVVRHFVSFPTGDIRDVHDLPDFVCVVAPGQQLDRVVAAVKSERKRLAS